METLNPRTTNESDALMHHQIVDVSITVTTDIEAAIGLFRSADDIRLHVIAGDGSGRVDFIHPHHGDRQQSTEFLHTLAEHALRMASTLSSPEQPWPDKITPAITATPAN